MKKQNQNVVNANQENKGEKVMNKNKISNNKFVKKGEERKEEKKAEIKANQEKEILDAIKPVDITGVMEAVEKNEAHCVRNEEGIATNVRGGKYIQKAIYLNGNQWTIAAKNEEELEAKEKAIKEEGLSGDGLYHKIVIIGGYPCECVGATLEELEMDILAVKKYAKKLSEGHILYDTDTAEQLCDAGLDKENLEEVKIDNNRYIINYNNLIINNKGEEVKCPCVLTFEGDLLVSLEGLSSALSKEDVKTILLERLNSYLRDHYDPLDDYESYDDELWKSDYETSDDSEGYYDDDVSDYSGDKVKIVYGNSPKEAESNDPIEVDQKTLEQYKDNYSYVRILDDDDYEQDDEEELDEDDPYSIHNLNNKDFQRGYKRGKKDGRAYQAWADYYGEND